MKKSFVFLIILTQVSLFGQEKQFTTTDELNYLLRDPYFSKCQIAVDVYNITKKESVFRHNEKYLLKPASNMKVITTAAALYFLGPDYKFKTEMKYVGSIQDSVLNGDIYFVGGFDPDFTLTDLDTMIIQLKEKGITTINGNIYADVSNMDSLFWGQGWMWDDDPSYDFPYMTPLVINDALMEVAIAPSLLGESAILQMIPESNYFKYSNNIVTVDNDTTDLTVSRDWINRSDSLILEGGLFVDAEPDTITINLKNTNQFFLTLAKESLLKNGFKLEGNCAIKTTPEDAQSLVLKERLFSDVIVNLNKTSDNLSAEMTLRAMAYETFGKYASAKKGIELIDSLIVEVGLNPDEYRLVDGSGVSHYNLVSVELLNEILVYFNLYHPELFEVLYNSFPTGGVDGTLKSRMENENVLENVHAKTGTLSGVSALCGYLTAKNGDLLSFAINTQNFVGSASTARKYQDRICEILSNME
jgi:serine-type D-Ala-D-Ala carboxypeptidase/endopeptidase (penicillin-binding protein 4)